MLLFTCVRHYVTARGVHHPGHAYSAPAQGDRSYPFPTTFTAFYVFSFYCFLFYCFYFYG